MARRSLALFALALAGMESTWAFAPPAPSAAGSVSRSCVRRRVAALGPAPVMGFRDMFDQLFGEPKDVPKSTAVARLNVMLASDRAALDPETLVKIRTGIIELVQQYVEIQPDDVILNIQNENRKSILTASLAIKGRKVLDTAVELQLPEPAPAPTSVATPPPPPPPPPAAASSGEKPPEM